MNILLTGDVQVGKSTIIHEILRRHPEWKPGGFVTVKAGKGVYIQPAPGNDEFSKKNLVGSRETEGFPKGFAGAFDREGTEIMEREGKWDLLVMDELGFMENEAEIFQQAVLRALEERIPVLGVVKPKATPFLDSVRASSGVVLLEVNPENRGEILETADRMMTKFLRNAQMNDGLPG